MPIGQDRRLLISANPLPGGSIIVSLPPGSGRKNETVIYYSLRMQDKSYSLWHPRYKK